MSAARDAILSAIRKGAVAERTAPLYVNPPLANDLAALFAAKAKAAVAEVHEIATPEDAPGAIWALLSAANAAPRLHMPENSPLRSLPWQRAPGLELSAGPPSGSDTAFSAADYGIAETGTLAFFSGPLSYSSWHYRPDREIVLMRRAAILPRLEDLTAFIATRGMPATLNLVTGPSRTADIEQTIELGAHGPRALHILLCD